MAATFLHHTLGRFVTAGTVLLAFLGTAPAQEQDCTVPTSFYATEPPLAKTATALASGQTVFIVALGGASTLGQAAGGPALAWPARLAVALNSRFPAARVKIDNRAVAHQTAREMVARLDRDVIALQPRLVIWEMGTTDAVQDTELDEFRQTVQAGIDQLRASGIEVVFMDMQFVPPTHAVINFERYEHVLHEVADANDVPLFRRNDLMRHWVENGVFDLMTENHDQVRLVASRLYDCLGRALADFVARDAQPAEDASPAGSGSQK